MTAVLSLPSGGWVLVGAGIFDGDQAMAAVAVRCRVGNPAPGADGQVGPAVFDEPGPISSSGPAPARGTGPSRNFHLLSEVTLAVTAELGSTTMTMGDLLGLQPGGVIELDREAGTPIDVLVNGTLIAKGEVVVVESQYAVRITEVVTESDQP